MHLLVTTNVRFHYGGNLIGYFADAALDFCLTSTIYQTSRNNSNPGDFRILQKKLFI